MNINMKPVNDENDKAPVPPLTAESSSSSLEVEESDSSSSFDPNSEFNFKQVTCTEGLIFDDKYVKDLDDKALFFGEYLNKESVFKAMQGGS